eukprot:7352158-Prymnesium_polylepis.3
MLASQFGSNPGSPTTTNHTAAEPLWAKPPTQAEQRAVLLCSWPRHNLSADPHEGSVGSYLR